MERNLVLEPQTVAQLAAIVSDVAKKLKGVPGARSDKDFLATRIIRLYGLGNTDLTALRRKLWESAAFSDKARARALQKATNAVEKAIGNVHRQRALIAALERRNLPTEEANGVLTQLLQTVETARMLYEEVKLEQPPTYAERTHASSLAAKALTYAQNALRAQKTERLRKARLAAGRITSGNAGANPKGWSC
jgi:hypothetical protein